MNWIISLLIACLLVFSFTIPGVVIAQTNDEMANLLQAPADFPEYIVVPQEDLNPFGISTLDTSTLSARTGEKSNLEVNQPAKKRQVEETAIELSPGEQNNMNFQPLSLKTRSNFYRWVDENGVINVTNDPDSLPSGYRK
ncbi:MAG: hypothetical protein ACRENZ_05470 [Thermodesulfobacteriota bacterium]